ncbi:HEAT repeat domain-containing protein [Alkalinema sp. FACHB-956]|uniref:HEAT repeat domain-containing protein n=1 Tax=Alkalinema sp. FACHB-956 TaxID=2692768 RepID=UPI0016892AC1|nr:HEAT repeat domain-containing protein [Alkalinema sp. FACHB-956]MBD2325387.1 HEAT repeat domain-containing protein [Alkalinema sp. FACHB-956]
MSQLEDLLQQCTVKLSIPGQLGWGTGFFVAPGWILTCAHVVQRSPEQVQVGWQGITLEAVVERSWPDPYDLALLRVAFSVDCNPPCVYLDGDVQSRDPLYLFGYPDEGDRQGEPRTFNCDGITGGEIPAILFNLGQVRPGMSGAPLLNQRTGKVCGMVKFTRDRSSDLGGGAILTREILNQLPELRKLQREFHAKDRRWVINPQTGIEFQRYREAVIRYYSQQRHLYTPTDALLPLEARSVERQTQNDGQERPVEKTVEPPLPVLVGLRQYALGEQPQHVLLAGRPGSGKSTTLRQLVVTLAEEGQVPVLVQLKGDRAVPELIQAEFRRMKQRVTAEQVDEWLLNERLVLLLDGINEIPTDELRRSLAQFRENNLTVPMIFTTRDLSLGGDLGIDKRLEMKPLSEPQMREFVGKYLPAQGERLLSQLRDRLREIAETPLLLKMLCDVFDPETNQIPKNRGELFQWFDRDYKRIKKEIEYVPVSENFWEFKSEILQYLAFYMIQGEVQTADLQPPLEPWLTIPKSHNERILETWLHQRGVLDAPTKAKLWLKDLYNYHLLQDAAKPEEIEFHHQLFQEYYAAEYLLRQLPTLTDEQLKQDYLNYLKWTEPIALMLALEGNEAQALRVVKIALDVDWTLGARLAGEVKSEFQVQTIKFVEGLQAPTWLKFQLLGDARSVHTIPRLLKLLEHADSYVQWIAAKAIGQITSESAIPGLLKLLEHDDSSARKIAANELGNISSKEAIPGLLKLLEHDDSSVRQSAARALGKIGSEASIPSLLKLVADTNSSVRWTVAEALGEINSEEAIPSLVKLLQHNKLYIRQSAAKALGKIGSKIAIPDLLKLLEYNDYYVRCSVVDALIQISSDRAIPGLLKLLEYGCPSLHWSVVEALVQIGSEAAIPELLKLLQHDNSSVRESAVTVLGRIGSETVIPDLRYLAKDPNSFVRKSIACALGEIGSETAIPDLRYLAKDPDSFVREIAVYALSEIDSEIAIPDLRYLAKDSDLSVRQAAIYALGKLGGNAAVPDLLKLLEDTNSSVLWRVAQSLGKIGSKAAIPSLLKLLGNTNSSAHWSIVEALGQIGSETAIPGLLKLLEKEKDSSVRGNVVKALGQIGSETAIPGLLKLLEKEKDSSVRGNVVKALGQIGSETAIPGLLKLLEEEKKSSVRGNVAAVLGQLAKEQVDVLSPYLPHLLNLISTHSGQAAQHIILAIQKYCKYYNYEIFQAHLAAQKGEPSYNSGSHPITYNIGQIGNLNTGNVTIHGDQLGESHR